MNHIILFEKFYQPNPKIKQRLDEIVKDLRVKHRGGRSFFDALDSEIKNILNEDMIIQLVKGNPNEWIVTSGEFGRKLYKMWKDGKFKCKGVVVFNGKISTFKIGVINYFPSDFDINNKDFIYVDDSYFSGQTVQKISEFLSNFNSRIKHVSVIYDGSKVKKKNVYSFFRYYDDMKNEKFLPKLRSLFKKVNPKENHKKVINNIRKIVDLECPTKITLDSHNIKLSIKSIDVEDMPNKIENEDYYPTLDSNINIDNITEWTTSFSHHLGLAVIKLIEDEKNFIIITLRYNKDYHFDMITWKEIYVGNNGKSYGRSPMVDMQIKPIYDSIRNYFDENGLFGNCL